MAMTLGGYTFAQDPNGVPMITKRKTSAKVETFESVSFFSWGLSFVGVVVPLSWDGMPYSMWAQLVTLYESDTTLVWDPQIQSGQTFTVNIEEFEPGTPVHSLKSTFLRGNASWVKDVKLYLLIMSEV